MAQSRPIPWYRSARQLLTHLRAQHQDACSPPDVLGYEDLRMLQRGGQGVVYLARHRLSGRRVALKVLTDDLHCSPRGRRRFEREVDLVHRLKHPNIVRVRETGWSSDGHPFLAMDYVDGVSLDEAWEALETTDQRVQLLAEIAETVHYAHQRGVIHRDLKPSNIRIDGRGHPRLLDFGLAKPVPSQDRHRSGISHTGEFLGTLCWSSPEQLQGHPEEIDVRSDVYSLGLLLHHGLTGELPYPVEGNLAQVVSNILHRAPSRFSHARRGASRDLQRIVLRCLAKLPERRYPSASHLAQDLRRVLAGEPIDARPAGWWSSVAALVRRHRVPSALLAVLLVSSLGFGISMGVLIKRARHSAQRASDAEAAAVSESQKVAAVNEFLLKEFLVPPGSGNLSEITVDQRVQAAARRIDADESLNERPLVAADLHHAMSFWLAAFPERQQEAERHVQTSLALRRSSLHPGHPAIADSLQSLVALAATNASWGPAESHARAELEIRRQHPSSATALANCLAWLAKILAETGRLREALPFLEECDSLFAQELGPSHPQTMATSDALREIRRALGPSAASLD